ncbi:hypothetical protein ACIBAC_00580 [Streptomyces sp. NPDC051362]|uniref:hypothetical protein n=1 Tax=Streptomyces sp. NPDC051362 TaxID=3365651 RepID=UPI003798A33F
MEPIVFTPQEAPTLRRAVQFLRRREQAMPHTAHAKTREGVLLGALCLDDQADALGGQAPEVPVGLRDARRHLFNHLVAPLAGGVVTREEARALVDALEAAVLAAADERLAAMALPEHLKGTLNAASYSDAWRHCRAVVQETAQPESAPPAVDAPHCNLPPSLRLPCGCCLHQICEDCERCAHGCECGGTAAK